MGDERRVFGLYVIFAGGVARATPRLIGWGLRWTLAHPTQLRNRRFSPTRPFHLELGSNVHLDGVSIGSSDARLDESADDQGFEARPFAQAAAHQ